MSSARGSNAVRSYSRSRTGGTALRVRHVGSRPLIEDNSLRGPATAIVFITRDVSAEELRGTLMLLTNHIRRYELSGYVEDLLNDRTPSLIPEKMAS